MVKVLTFITGNVQPIDPNPYNLKVGSFIQYGEPAQYGVIKWIGNIPDEADVCAGVEMVRHVLLIFVCVT